MSKPWARKFYNSRAWKLCRTAYIAKVFGLCEHPNCGDPGFIVHHKLFLTPKNINDATIALNHDNLEYLCQLHHNQIHHGSHEPITAEGTMFDSEGNLIQVGEGFKREW